jgi:hypothetical protein
MADGLSQLGQSPLSVGDLGAKLVLTLTVLGLTREIFVGIIAQGHGSSRKHVFEPGSQPGLLSPCRLKRVFDRTKNSFGSEAIHCDVPVRRARLEVIDRSHP